MSVAFFIPHLGCPHACSFCNQRTITGHQQAVTPREVEETLRKRVLSRKSGQKIEEISFFGGSFTAIDPHYRTSLLDVASRFCREGLCSSIRISTRPDAIGEDILRELWDAGVRTVELGAQSMDDAVLEKNRRGHTVQQVRDASRQIRDKGFFLILQMMTGLPGDSNTGAKETARELALLKPDGVRIYPALTLRGTDLDRQYHRSSYQPPSLEQATALCAELLDFWEQQGIPVIRLGLQDSHGIQDELVAGPYHPAFRELCEGIRMAGSIRKELERKRIPKGKIEVHVPRGKGSHLTGHGRQALRVLEELNYHIVVRESGDLSSIKIIEEGERACV